MKAKLINFERYPTKSNQTREEVTLSGVIADIESAIKSGYDTIVGLLLADGFLYKNNDTWNRLHNTIISKAYKLGIKEVVLVPGMSYDNNVNCKIIPFNFNLHTTWNSYKNKQLEQYNPQTNKFLFFGGVPDRPNRIGLLYDLYRQGLLEHAEWSFFKPWTSEQELNSKTYFSNDDAYEQFIKFAERSFDNVYESSKTYGTGVKLVDTEWTHDSSWIDPALFSRTSLSLVSEGHPGDTNNNSKFLTEKTYRAFVQGHPLLLAANPSMFKYAKELGFKMFENYFPKSSYALESNESVRLNQIVENLTYFVSNNIDFTSDVKYNRQHFFKLAETNALVLDNLKDLGVKQTDIDYWFDRKGFGHLL